MRVRVRVFISTYPIHRLEVAPHTSLGSSCLCFEGSFSHVLFLVQLVLHLPSSSVTIIIIIITTILILISASPSGAWFRTPFSLHVCHVPVVPSVV